MGIGNFEEKLCLSNVASGNLEREFQNIYRDIVGSLKHGEKAKVTINLDFSRVANTDTMMNLTYQITTKLPPKKKASVCQITGDNTLKTDKVEQQTIINMSMIEGGKN